MTTGNTIASLNPATSSDITQNSLFVLATRSKYLSGQYETTNVDANSLARYFASTIVQNMHFGSMTGEVSSDYSKFNHNHDSKYNKLSVQYNWDPIEKTDYSSLVYNQSSKYVEYKFTGYPVKKPTMPASLSIGNVFEDGVLSTLYAPLSNVIGVLVVPWEVAEPQFGQIKFIARNEMLSIDPTLDTFDGWLYPDGTTEYALSDFRLSDVISQHPYCVKYVDDEKFILKTCNDFIKIDNNNASFAHFPYHNAIVDHVHQVDIVADGKISAYADVPASSTAGNGGFLHGGNGKSTGIQYDPNNPKKKKTGYISAVLSNYSSWQNEWASRGNKINFEEACLSARCSVDISMTNAFMPAENDIQTFPSHMTIPIMVYVGAKKDI